jgi:hypothetical protein
MHPGLLDRLLHTLSFTQVSFKAAKVGVEWKNGKKIRRF